MTDRWGNLREFLHRFDGGLPEGELSWLQRVDLAIRMACSAPPDPRGCGLARAALEAMREPTYSMDAHGHHAAPETLDGSCYRIWQAMITAALADPPQVER